MLRQLSLNHVHDALFWVSLYKGRSRIGLKIRAWIQHKLESHKLNWDTVDALAQWQRASRKQQNCLLIDDLARYATWIGRFFVCLFNQNTSQLLSTAVMVLNLVVTCKERNVAERSYQGWMSTMTLYTLRF